MAKSSELKVTSIDEILKVAKGEVVELPGFIEGVPFIARLKRPSMLALTKSGKIPNDLLVEANKLFVNGVDAKSVNVADSAMMSNMFNILQVICEESFVEPSYKELEEAGITLTDEQQLAIFSYTQSGVKALKPFR